jgi:hypothetical protein
VPPLPFYCVHWKEIGLTLDQIPDLLLRKIKGIFELSTPRLEVDIRMGHNIPREKEF